MGSTSCKEVRVSLEEYEFGKYRCDGRVTENGNFVYHVKVWYNDDGSINEELTYTPSYLKKRNKEFLKSIEKTDEFKEYLKGKEKSYSQSDNDGCLMKLIKIIFRLLWKMLKSLFN